MSQKKNSIRLVHATRGIATVALVVLLAGAGCKSKEEEGASVPQGKAFASADEGFTAFIKALKPLNKDELGSILGPDGKDIISSGDDVADQTSADTFVAAYERKKNIVVKEDRATLIVGDNDWPLPIPMVQINGKWQFDTAEGEDEILARRIGRNELATIQTCRGIVDAQQEYSDKNRGSGDAVYAQKLISDPGQHNGLYWETKEGEPESPLGPGFVKASAQGYDFSKKSDTGPKAFHGYLYRLLTAQGPSAPGGARSYLSNDKMTGGFALVAWPVDYDNSGIMTFMVSNRGVVYQKDLGEKTGELADAMKAFDPDKDWDIVPENTESP